MEAEKEKNFPSPFWSAGRDLGDRLKIHRGKKDMPHMSSGRFGCADSKNVHGDGVRALLWPLQLFEVLNPLQIWVICGGLSLRNDGLYRAEKY